MSEEGRWETEGGCLPEGAECMADITGGVHGTANTAVAITVRK